MRCIICDHDEWENVDKHRFANKGMHVCKHCGFVSYPELYKSEEEIKEYYRTSYRNPPNYNNACTTQRKLHIHGAFLKELLPELKKKEKPVICEIGAAYGVVLHWLKSQIPKGELHGTELTLSYRRNAYHEYGLNLTEDFDKSKKYDLIISFKVAEHQLDVDKRLREYVECLNDDGHIYISVPTWFNRLCNFGASGFDLEYYYSPDHINVWSRKLFKTLLKKVGLKIVKEDHWLYDDTFLCVRDDSLMSEAPEYEDPSQVKAWLAKIKEAAIYYMDNDFKNAIEAWPNFPDAWARHYELNRALPHKESPDPSFEDIWNTFIKPATIACPESTEIVRLAADVCMRYDQFGEAIKWLNFGLQKRPNMPGFLAALANCFRQIAIRTEDEQEKIKLITEARDCTRYLRDVDLSSKPDAISWIYSDNANIPMPGEKTN